MNLKMFPTCTFGDRVADNVGSLSAYYNGRALSHVSHDNNTFSPHGFVTHSISHSQVLPQVLPNPLQNPCKTCGDAEPASALQNLRSGLTTSDMCKTGDKTCGRSQLVLQPG